MKQILLSLILIISFNGCQAKMYGTAEDLNQVSVGMNKSEVLKIMGKPMTSSANSDKNEETLIYKRMAHTLGWNPHPYFITFRNGKVVSYGRETK